CNILGRSFHGGFLIRADSRSQFDIEICRGPGAREKSEVDEERAHALLVLLVLEESDRDLRVSRADLPCKFHYTENRDLCALRVCRPRNRFRELRHFVFERVKFLCSSSGLVRPTSSLNVRVTD